MKFTETLRTYARIALSTFVIWLLADQIIRITGIGSVLPEHYSKQNFQRQAAPYIEFKGAPNKLDHDQYGYRRVPDAVREDSLKISFFGGSTGYQGEPPIPALLEEKLSNKLGRPVQVANFSVVSSNHRQHLHNIIESRELFKPDIVIFYGGYNETLQSAFYDPRPGFPYNFYYRSETSPFRQILVRYSPTFFMLEELLTKNEIGGITGLTRLRKTEMPLSEQWNARIIDKYIDTLDLAADVTSAFGSDKCTNGVFFFFYQPYQVPDDFLATHASIREQVKHSNFGYDISNIFEKSNIPNVSVYTDIVHVRQTGRTAVANEMTALLSSDSRLLDCTDNSDSTKQATQE